MTQHPQTVEERRFPLKRYYLLYGGLGSIVFYILLVLLIARAERQALQDEYAYNTADKARAMFADIERDLLEPRGWSIETLDAGDSEQMASLRSEIEDLVASDFRLAKVKLFRADGLTLYDHTNPANEGSLYDARSEAGFTTAASGQVHCEIEAEDDGRRFMEAYLPIHRASSGDVVAVFEIYEDVTRFEAQVRRALIHALALPTIVFICFNIVLFLIVARANRIIGERTDLLVAIRQNMEKYLSRSAVDAICQAVSSKTDLFRGERQQLVIFFSDIRGFTAYSEVTAPEDVVQTLNRLFDIQARIIHRHGGVIDKFVGDEIMAIFPPDRAADAVTAADEILAAIAAADDVEKEVGIGIHAGDAVVGSLGTADRRDYTAIGDTINVGARLCGASPGSAAYISPAVYAALPADLQARLSERNTLTLKGKADSFVVHVLRPTGTPGELSR